jgi:hypothetical protein
MMAIAVLRLAPSAQLIPMMGVHSPDQVKSGTCSQYIRQLR